MGALKVVLLGDSAVGKSSLLRSYTTGTFDAHVPNTIGAAFVSTEHTVGERTVKMEIWDTAGQERYRSLTPMYYRNGRVALVCFDMSNATASFERARYWLDQLAVSGPSDISVKLVGTKSDLSPNSSNLETNNLETSKQNLQFNQRNNNLETNQRNTNLETTKRHKDSESNERNKESLDKSNLDQINRDLGNSETNERTNDSSDNLDTSNLENSHLDNSDTTSGMVEIQRYCLEHDVPFYSTSAKTNTGISKIFDDIVNEVEEDFFNDPAPQILLQERPQSKCC